MRLRYDIVDVFTDRPFAGNQLAVVHDAAGLSTEQCLAIAREFNFSETTFPDPTAPDRYDVRIFTPGVEIPFAGHPTLGTAWVLRERGLVGEGAVTQVCGAGDIAVLLDEDDAHRVELTAAPRDLVGPLDDDVAAMLLADLGLSISDLAGPVWVTGCGLTFAQVPVVADAVARARLPQRRMAEYGVTTRDPFEGINLHSVSSQAGDGSALPVHARVFVPDVSVAEDPATGSAAAGLGLALVATGALPGGGRYRISQGVEMGRPSVLEGRVDVADGTAVACHVAGGVHPVASGEIDVPAG
jgi:trans-2,3-dihydro-3-hydroxyanthranilate isomerase